jgi:hypothetical protein
MRVKSLILYINLLISISTFGQFSVIDFSPKSAPVGGSIVITGIGFSSVASQNIVKIGGIKAVISSASNSSITAIVPPGQQHMPVSVTVNGLTAFSRNVFVTTFSSDNSKLHSTQMSPQIEWDINPYSKIVVSADFDGDHKAEVVTVKTGGDGIAVYKNTSIAGAIKLDSPLSFLTGCIPFDIVCADFNGDGWMDLAASHGTNEKVISVFINKGLGTIDFMPRIILNTEKNPSGLDIGDIDLDGLVDIIVANTDSDNVSVFRNTSFSNSVSFSNPTNLLLPSFSMPKSVGVSDFDGDGRVDIAVTCNWGNVVCFFRNTSAPNVISFQTVSQISASNTYARLRLSDLDLDGRPDIIVTNSENQNVAVHINNSTIGNIAFLQRKLFLLNSMPLEVELVDINGDGRKEIAVASYYERSIILLKTNGVGNGMTMEELGRIRPGQKYSDSMSRRPESFGFADLDMDGKPDLYSLSGDISKLTINRNRINEPLVLGFAPYYGNVGTKIRIKGARFSGSNATKIANQDVASFTVINDSTIEAILGNNSSGALSIHSSTGFSFLDSFVQRPIIEDILPGTAKVGHQVQIIGKGFHLNSDFNKVRFGNVQATVLASNSNSLTVLIPPGASLGPVSISVNGIQAFSPNWFSPKLEQNETKFDQYSFSDTIINEVGNFPAVVITEDLNNDGKPDWIVSNFGSHPGVAGVTVFHNISTIENIISKPKQDLTSIGTSSIKSIALGDLNGDGLPDLAASIGDSVIRIMINKSSMDSIFFEFAFDLHTPLYSRIEKIAISDIDNNGRPDILAIVENYGGKLVVFGNVTSSSNRVTFLTRKVFSSSFYESFDIADINNDGYLDLIGAWSYRVVLLMNASNQSSINFVYKEWIVSIDPARVRAVDLDSDGKLDIVLTNQINGFYVLKNSSSETQIGFDALQLFQFGEYWNARFIAIAELNGDNRPDLIFTPGKFVFRNTSVPGQINFDVNDVAKFQYFDEREIGIGDFNLDGKTDFIAAFSWNALGIYKNRIAGNIILPLCPASGVINLLSDVTGINYQWQVRTSDTSSFQQIVNNSSYQNVTSGIMQLINPPTNWYGYSFRCQVDGKYSREYKLKFELKWLSPDPSGWHIHNYWNCGNSLPDEYTDVIIQNGEARILYNGICRSLIILPGAKVTVSPDATLTIKH